MTKTYQPVLTAAEHATLTDLLRRSSAADPSLFSLELRGAEWPALIYDFEGKMRESWLRSLLHCDCDLEFERDDDSESVNYYLKLRARGVEVAIDPYEDVDPESLEFDQLRMLAAVLGLDEALLISGGAESEADAEWTSLATKLGDLANIGAHWMRGHWDDDATLEHRTIRQRIALAPAEVSAPLSLP